MKKPGRIVILFLSILVIAFGTWRAAQLQYQTGMGDMRGRVVGARLVSQGKLPYYYIWYPGDPLTYYFNQMVDTPRPPPTTVSALTASPAFLQMMEPVAFQQQYKIDWGFFILFHLAFFISIALALSYAQKQYQPYVWLLMVPIIITDGWLGNFVTVQYYMLFGFMLLIISLLLLQKKHIAAGLVFAALILLRPTAILFALPFLIYKLRYVKFMGTTFIGLALYALITFLNPFQKSLWQQYFRALKAHQAVHMSDVEPSTAHKINCMQFLPRPFEGVDYFRLDSLQKIHPIAVYPEASGFKSFYNAVRHHKPPAALLAALLLLSTAMIWFWLFIKYRKDPVDPNHSYRLILAGMLFYFLSNFFSTITIAIYHFPQWWAVAAIFGIFYQRIPKMALGLFVLGIILNLYILPGFKGKHFLSEVFLLAGTCWAVLAPATIKHDDLDSEALQGHA